MRANAGHGHAHRLRHFESGIHFALRERFAVAGYGNGVVAQHVVRHFQDERAVHAAGIADHATGPCRAESPANAYIFQPAPHSSGRKWVGLSGSGGAVKFATMVFLFCPVEKFTEGLLMDQASEIFCVYDYSMIGRP